MAMLTFGMGAFLEASTALRSVGAGAGSMEEVAGEIVGYLRDRFLDKSSGDSALPLARLYVTKRSDELEPAIQDFVRATAPDAFAEHNVICLTLLGTAGEEPDWNNRRASLAHKAIPLPSVEALRRSPMIAQLVAQLGVDARHLVEPDPALFQDLAQRTYNVFHVPEARDSAYVPAQNGFVIPYGIRSVVGFGGLLPDGMLFAVVLFSRSPIPAAALDAFGAIALSIKVALLTHVPGPTFAGQSAPTRPIAQQARLDAAIMESRVTTLSQLLDARASVAEQEALRFERDAVEADERAAELAASREALAVSEARKTAILDGALDCIIGMDSYGHITDFNHAAEAAFGYDRADVVGHVLADLLIPHTMRERHRRGLAEHLITGRGPLIGRRIEVNAVRRDGTEFPIELTVTQVTGSEPPLFSGYLRDITDRRQAEQELAASRERLAHIARTLQTSLLPPSLPAIDGVELAAAFRALGDGYEVGGDFYDAFQLADGKWALILGDVCGKGSDAAVITALARYTLRAAAMRSPTPDAVLSILNEAIHRQHPDQFCTAVYAVVDPPSGTIDMALGGHPQPILLRAGGELSLVGTPSPLLGPYPTWEGVTDTVTLEPADTLLLYSDGLTDARKDRDFYDDERLASIIRASRGLDVDEIVRRIETDVLDFAGVLNDDLAILAIQRLLPTA